MPGPDLPEGQLPEGQDPNAPTSSPGHPIIACPTTVSPQTVTTFKAGDTLPDLIVILQDAAGNPINLSGATVVFRMGAPMDDTPKVDESVGLDPDPTTGRVTYSWTAGDLDTAQDWRAEFHVTFGDDKTITVPSATYLTITVLPEA